jgi:hypothetical protein
MKALTIIGILAATAIAIVAYGPAKRELLFS